MQSGYASHCNVIYRVPVRKVLKDRIVVVTGASSGIGRATAVILAEMGCKLMLTARNGARLKEIAEAAADSGGVVATFSCDITDPAAVRALFGETRERYGGLDVLINNAGMGEIATVRETTDDLWMKTIATNLNSVFL